MFKQGAFQIDPNMTPDQVANKRAMIAALLPKFGSAKYVGEGIGQLATGVMAGRQGRKLDEIEGKGTASANSLWERLMGTANSAQSPDMGPLTVLGMKPEATGPAMPPPDPNSPHALGDDAMAALGKPAMKTAADPASIKAGLVARGLPEHVAEGFVMNFQDESGLNPGINEAAPTVPGSRGGFGLYQLTGPRRRAYEAYAAERGVPLDDVDAQLDFMMMELQGPEAAAWSKISGTQNAGEAGAAIVNSFLRPAEEHRASRAAEYLGGGGMPDMGTAAPAPTSAPTIPINELYMALQNPWLSPQQQGLITSMIQEQQQASDPLRQLELQKAQLELEQMQNPTQDPMAAIELAQAQLDYEQDKTGTGADPATYGTTLQFFTDPKDGKLKAGVIGNDGTFKAVDPPSGGEWAQGVDKVDAGTKWVFYDKRTGEKLGEEVKDIRGAEAEKAIGEAEGKSAVAAEGDIATADTTLTYIDSLRNHPGRAMGSGGSAYSGLVPGTNAKEFQIEVERLKSGAFLTAINELRGMGALSNAEGQTATAAIAALDPYGTEEGFLKRLEEYERIVKLGRDRAAKRTKAPEGAAAPEAPAATPTADGGWKTLPSGIKIRVKP